MIGAFENATGESYSKLLEPVMSKFRCNYEILKVDLEAKRAGEIYVECFLDNVTIDYTPATKYISIRITEA
jgi:hypothetical protein